MQQDSRLPISGGRFDFDDGGTYCGGWEDGKAHGYGVCTGPKSQGEYSGSWHYGFEVSGVYTWPSGSTYEGHWQNGKRHGFGVEARGRWVYRGEWTQGFKGRYGVRQSTTSGAKYGGTWANGLQDGYGAETYADGGTYQGQWMRGMRHGYGVRTSAPFGMASHFRNKNIHSSMSSLRSDAGQNDPADERDRMIDDCRGGFVLKAKSDEPPPRRRSLVEKSSNLKKTILQGLRLKKQRSTGDIDQRGTGSIKSTGSTASWNSTESGQSAVTVTSVHTDSNISFVSQDDVIDPNVVETYMGEWKNDKRNGFGISERSDGLRYEGEWYNNKKYGYGVTTFKDGAKEEGKYKNNVLITSSKKKHIFLIRSSKFRERIESAVNASIRGSQTALTKADIAISRAATARGKGEQADIAAMHAREDSDIARLVAKQFAPDFHQPGSDLLRKQLIEQGGSADLSKFKTLKGRDELPPHIRSKSLYLRHAPGAGGEGNETPSPGSHEYDRGVPPRLQVSDGDNYIDGSQRSFSDRLVEPSSNHSVGLQSRPTIRRRPQDLLSPTPSLGSTGGGFEVPSLNVSEEPETEPNGRIFRAGSIRRGGLNSSFRDDPETKKSFHQAMQDHYGQYEKETLSRPTSQTSMSSAGAPARPPRSRQGTVESVASTQQQNIQHHPLHPLIQNKQGSQQQISQIPPLQKQPSIVILPDNEDAGSRSGGSRRSTLPNLYDANGIIPGPGMDDGVRNRAPQIFATTTTPIRTGSLYAAGGAAPRGGGGGGGGGGARVAGGPPKRKKSLPNDQALPKVASKMMSREEVSALSHLRREDIRRMADEAERYRANPLLYIFNPHVKEWLSRQQFVMLVLFINISLAIMFFKLLT